MKKRISKVKDGEGKMEKYEGPEGIFRELVNEKMREEIPLLKVLRKH